jgi:hypothetical protein
VDPVYAPWGLSDAVFYGPPAVASPAAGDRWRGGESYDIVWDAAGAPAGSQVGMIDSFQAFFFGPVCLFLGLFDPSLSAPAGPRWASRCGKGGRAPEAAGCGWQW